MLENPKYLHSQALEVEGTEVSINKESIYNACYPNLQELMQNHRLTIFRLWWSDSARQPHNRRSRRKTSLYRAHIL